MKYLGDELRKLGYDVVIANFPNFGSYADGSENAIGINTTDYLVNQYLSGTDPRPEIPARWKKDFGATFIERNGLAIVNVIKFLNQELIDQGINEKIVVVGPSMGGLISRYALAYMEKQERIASVSDKPKWKHNTRLWFSFDSPHLGANIPLSFQKAVNFAAFDYDEEKAKSKYQLRLCSKAAKQLLLIHIESSNGNSPHSFRNIFVNNMNSNGIPEVNNIVNPTSTSFVSGFPVNIRRIAITNGWLAGGPLMDYHSDDLTFNSFGMRSFAGTRITEGQIHAWTYPKYLETGKNIFYGYFYKMDSWGRITDLGHGSRLTRKTFSCDSYGNGPSIDLCSGGTDNSNISTQKEMLAGYDEALHHQTLPTWVTRNPILPSFTFIPYRSALAMKTGTHNGLYPNNEDLTQRDLVCNCETPFDSYYGMPDKSYPHMTVTEGMVNFVMAEINNNPAPHLVENTKINGPDHLCTGTSASFSASPVNAYPCHEPTITGNNFSSWSVSDGSVTLTLGTSPSNLYGVTATSTTNQFMYTIDYDKIVYDRQNKPCHTTGSKTISNYTLRNPIVSPSNMGIVCSGDHIRLLTRINQLRNNTSNITVEVLSGPYVYAYINTSPINNWEGAVPVYVNIGRPQMPMYQSYIKVRLVNDCNEASDYITIPVTINVCKEGPKVELFLKQGVFGSTHYLSGAVDQNINSNNQWAAKLVDNRGTLIQSTQVQSDGQFIFDVQELKLQPAMYSVYAISDTNITRAKNWPLLTSEGSQLIVSPNPAVETIDDFANAELFNPDSSVAPYFVSFTKENGVELDTFTTYDSKFALNLHGLQAGIYPITVTSANGSVFAEDVNLKLLSEPYLQLDHNPVSSTLSGKLINALAGTKTVTISIVGVLGLPPIVQSLDLDFDSGFSLNVSSLQAGIYTMVLNTGTYNYTIQFSKQ